MTDADDPVGEDDLQAYVDDRLTEARRIAVIRHLEANPAVKARVRADKAMRDWLRQSLGPIEEQSIPDRLRVNSILRRQRDLRRRHMLAAAASVVLLLAGGAGGWFARGIAQDGGALRQRSTFAATTADAIAAHRLYVTETVHPVEVSAGQEQHLVQWLSRRLKHQLTAPNLAQDGYMLMGGRLLPASGEAAAQFMYENGSGARLTLYVRAADGGDTRFRFITAQGVAAFSWVDQGLAFALVGPLDREHLLSLADTIYKQLDPDHRTPPDAAL